MNEKIDKHIDFTQFPLNKDGSISWKNSIGVVADFYYCGEKHTLKILGRGNPTNEFVTFQVDDMQPETARTQKIKYLLFDDLFYKPNYLYNIGDIVNGVIILEQLYFKRTENSVKKEKFYRCKCLVDGHVYIVQEHELKTGRKCPKCVGRVLIVGYNDLATTDPDIMKYLLNKEDGRKHTRGSNERIWVVCPICKHKKLVKITDLVHKGFSCPRCSDGLSYPNKFAFDVFIQISEQYQEYITEYSPDWIKPKKYDHYILFEGGKEIIVEMDGGFHNERQGKYAAKYDKYKDELAKEHGIDVIRVDCSYNNITKRFDYIKTEFIKKLSHLFDLSNVDWDSANKTGISSRLVEVVKYYNENQFMSNQQIADKFHVNVVTIRHYLAVGEKLGLCEYIRVDPNRCKNSIPLILYDSNDNMIGVYVSSRHMAECMKDKNFRASSIRTYSRNGMPYKGYIIKQITWDEYESLQNSF